MRAVVLVSALFLAVLAVPCPARALSGRDPVTKPEHKVILREITLLGATQVPPGEQDEVRANLLAREYEGQDWDEEVTARIRDAWQRQGYFRADVELLHEVLGGNESLLEVVAVANIEEGQLYRFGELRWKNGEAFSPAKLSSLFPLVEGEVFDPDKIRQGLEDLRKLYAVNGYLNFTPVPETEFDDVQAVINLEIDLDEGPQFRLGSVEFHTQDGSLMAKLWSSWKLRVGDVYDARLVEDFFLENKELMPECSPEECIRFRQDVRAQTIHLRIFLGPPPLPDSRVSAHQTTEREEGGNPVPSLRQRD